MPLLKLEEAALRLDAPIESLQDWVQKGLLTSQICVDENELFELGECMGWLRLSAENWDDLEDE